MRSEKNRRGALKSAVGGKGQAKRKATVKKPALRSKVSAGNAAARRSETAGSGKRSVASLRGELLLSEARFSSLIDTAASPVLVLSPTFTIVEINAEGEELYGLPRRALIGVDYVRLGNDGPRAGLTGADLKSVLAGRSVRSREGTVRRPDGTDRVLLWNATRLLDARKKPIGIIAVGQDITERQRAEEALREREARLSSIIATAPDAIITIDERGIVQSFSAAAERLFGYSAGEVVGRNVKILMPSPHYEAHDGYLERYLRTGEKRIIGIGRKVEAKRKDGSIFPMELAVGEVHLGATRIFTGFIRDLTARAKMEEELRQSQKMEAIGQLTGGVAHDFNNLLTVISGNLEMLESRLEGANRDILREAQEAAELGAKLSNRLLAFGRRQPLNPKPIDLSALVGSMGDLLRRSLGESIDVEMRLAPDLPMTLADPGQVENVLLNLAINARDAMPGGGKLLIEASEAEIDDDYATAHPDVHVGRYVLLAVTDTGAGMPPDVRERAFEPFFTTKGPGMGSGLGLSMVYGFVKQSGGHVQLYSELGRGTTVRIYLPVTDDERRTAPRKTDGGDLGAARGEVVLVVEDDDRVRRVSVRRLQDLGYRIIEAANARAALDHLERGEPVDLVFTDVIMPGGMTGIDLARAARASRPDLKVLFTSGYAEPTMLDGGIRMANADWLGKPYKTTDLAAKLRALLDR